MCSHKPVWIEAWDKVQVCISQENTSSLRNRNQLCKKSSLSLYAYILHTAVRHHSYVQTIKEFLAFFIILPAPFKNGWLLWHCNLFVTHQPLLVHLKHVSTIIQKIWNPNLQQISESYAKIECCFYYHCWFKILIVNSRRVRKCPHFGDSYVNESRGEMETIGRFRQSKNRQN